MSWLLPRAAPRERIDAAACSEDLPGMPVGYMTAVLAAKKVLREGGECLDPLEVFGVQVPDMMLDENGGFFRLNLVFEYSHHMDYRWAELDGLVLVSCGLGFHLVRVGGLEEAEGVTLLAQVRAITRADSKARFCLRDPRRRFSYAGGIEVLVTNEACSGLAGLLDPEVQEPEVPVPPELEVAPEGDQGPGADCFLRVVPRECQEEARRLFSHEPGAMMVMEFLAGLPEDYELPSAVLFEMRNRLVHAVNLSGEPAKVRDVVLFLASLPEGTVLAGRCFRLGFGCLGLHLCGDCRAPREKLRNDFSDLQEECTCGRLTLPQGQVPFTGAFRDGKWRPVLSRTDPDEVVYLYDRGPVRPNGACRVVSLRGNVHAAVRVHKKDGKGVISVAGEHLEMLVPRGSSLLASGDQVIEAPEDAQVVIVYGADTSLLCTFVGDKVPEYVEVRNRGRSAWLRRMHTTGREDPAETFSRFWTKQGEGLGMLSVGAYFRDTPPNALVDLPREQSTTWDGFTVEKDMRPGLYRAGLYGTKVEVTSGTVLIGPVRLGVGGTLVLGRYPSRNFHVVGDSSEEVKTIVTTGDDAYCLDDGGPSGSDFYPEY